MAELETDLSETAGDTIRIPRNLMGLLRQSYDTREKILDWMLALLVSLALVWMYRDELWACFTVDPDPNAGRADQPVPSMDVAGAVPAGDVNARLYTYNMPVSRTIRYAVAPSMTPAPIDPSSSPVYP